MTFADVHLNSTKPQTINFRDMRILFCGLIHRFVEK